MSVLSIAFPVEATLPALQVIGGNLVAILRPMMGFGALAAILVVFKPLLIGLLRAALLVIKPRQTLEERSARTLLQSALMLNHMARDLEAAHPSLAAELRSFASRN
jgi:hypothetical protein